MNVILGQVVEVNFASGFRTVSENLQSELIAGFLVVTGHHFSGLANSDDLKLSRFFFERIIQVVPLKTQCNPR